MQIKEVIEQSVENALTDDPEAKVGGMVQVSGIRFCYDPGQAFGGRVRRITLSGEPLETARRYRVVTNSMLADGGHRYATFLQGLDRVASIEQYALVRRGLMQRGRVRTPEGGRISECKGTR